MNTNLKYYLAESMHGNREAAYQAARIMTFENYNDVMIQNQYRHSAKLGYAPAKRELGILGLCFRLVEPNSTTSNINYNKTFKPAVNWLKEAAVGGDGVAIFLLGKCYQFGLGTEKNTDIANSLYEISSSMISQNNMVALNAAMTILNETTNNAEPQITIAGFDPAQILALVG